MNLDYALVTSSSLPQQVRESVNYVSLDKDQWLDLVEYSEVIVNEDEGQDILLLICARGTPEQEEADRLEREKKAAEEAALHAELRDLRREVEDLSEEVSVHGQEAMTREEKREELLRELAKLSDENEAPIDAAQEKERLRKQREAEAAERMARLRKSSESIFNGLYNK